MNRQTRYHDTELAVVGAGLCGCAATLFALNRGIRTTQIGNTGALAYTSGYFDLLGVDQGVVIDEPWETLDRLRAEQPRHPYARIPNREISKAFSEFVNALKEMGLQYTVPGEQNHMALLPNGGVKPTYCMPQTMSQGPRALAAQARTLIIDFNGLQGFSAREISENLCTQWHQIRTGTLSFPGMENTAPLYAEVMARSLEVPQTRAALAESIKSIAGDAEYIGLPAILGIHRPDDVHRDMVRLIGLPVFEIPTIPPAVAGIRLRELLEQQLMKRGADVISQYNVAAIKLNDNSIELSYEDHFGTVIIVAQQVLLASGRFLSGGLRADREQIRESLLDLPVKQPDKRDGWFSPDYFDPRGHEVNRAGVLVNDEQQVVDFDNRILDDRLHASGILLADQDWIRQRAGAGIALSSAYRAIQSIQSSLSD